MKPLSKTLTEENIAFSFPLQIEDANGKETYHEDNDGYWRKSEYDTDGNQTHYETSGGFWRKIEYDTVGNETYYENSDGQKTGTPKAKHSGKVVTVDGIEYKLKENNQ